LFLLPLSYPSLVQHRLAVALDRPTPEMEAENLFAKQEPAVPEANHKSQLSVGWQPFYNAFARMGMRYCL
jgi:hypothetical protein